LLAGNLYEFGLEEEIYISGLRSIGVWESNNYILSSESPKSNMLSLFSF